MILAVLLLIIIPSSLLVWLANILNYTFSNYEEPLLPLSPVRWALSVIFPIFMINWGLKRKSLDKTGASIGFVVGFVLTLSNYCFLAALFMFFVSGSKVTKFRAAQKRTLEAEFKEGGQRNWVQVLCNGGVATELAVIYMIEAGCGEYAIDFRQHYTRSWLSVAVFSSLACCAGDTFSSEVGSVIGSADPRLITTLKKVPRGTNGGISLVGTLSSGVGGLLVGLGYYLVLLLTAAPHSLEDSPPQWPILAIAMAAGFLGSVIDSYLGATVQYSGYNEERKCIVDFPGPGVQDVSGSPFLDNHSVNLLASCLTALVVPYIAFRLWPLT